MFLCETFFCFVCLICIVQIPPSTTYVPPMKRPMEEEESTDEKNPNKKKKKLQKKCKCSSYVHNWLVVEFCTHCTKHLTCILLFSSRGEGRAPTGHECPDASEPAEAGSTVQTHLSDRACPCARVHHGCRGGWEEL